MPKEDTYIYKTKFEIVVLSRGPFVIDKRGDSDPFDLAEINYAITDGDCLGQVYQKPHQIVSPRRVKQECLKLGNDGSFFEED